MNDHNVVESAYKWLRLSGEAASSEGWSDAQTNMLQDADEADLQALADLLCEEFDEISGSASRVRIVIQSLASRIQGLKRLSQTEGNTSAQELDNRPSIEPNTLARLYEQLSGTDSTAAAHCLQILALQMDEESIDTLAGLLAEVPPTDWTSAGVALSPLWNASGEILELFFDRLDGGFMHPATLAVLLDLANYSVRRQKLSLHPWVDRKAELASLLTNVTLRLEKLERNPAQFGERVEEVQQVLGDSVALSVALCDALGFMGGLECAEPLRASLNLSHRRIQCEAAGALARMGVDEGINRLVALASDPVARLRAVAYAEELGFANRIDENLKHPISLAEAELVSWLANPEQFGFPPQSIELFDSKTQFWPSFEDPQDCYLFKYSYQLPHGIESNIGIAGPLTYAFHANLSGLPVDDIYAAFAGWQAEHEEIFEVPMALLNHAQRSEADRLQAHFEHSGFEVIQSIALTFLLGECSLLASLKRDGTAYFGITSGEESLCLPVAASDHSVASNTLTAEMILMIFRGRKLLRTFNP